VKPILACLVLAFAACSAHPPAGSQPASAAAEATTPDDGPDDGTGCPVAADPAMALEARIVLKEAVPATEADPAISCPDDTTLAERVVGIGNSDVAEVLQRFCQRPDGIRHGPFISRFATAVLEHGSYEAGVRQGPWEFADTAGAATQSGAFSRGHRHGRWVSRHPNGTMAWQGRFECGEHAGEFVWWNPDGTELQRRTF
jgi:hypothetical protein